jgi:hypothetical protein
VPTNVVTVDSTDEDVTDACATYRADEVYPALVTPTFVVQHFSGADAQRGNVLSALQTAKPRLVTGSGHGFPTTFTGQGREAILEIGGYQRFHVQGSIIHLLSCEAGEQLGVDLVANGCRAFFGYNDDFVFPIGEPELFLECDSVIDLTLAGGGTAEEAYDDTIAAFNQSILRLKKVGRVWLAIALERNRNCLCAPSVDAKWGDLSARL